MAVTEIVLEIKFDNGNLERFTPSKPEGVDLRSEMEKIQRFLDSVAVDIEPYSTGDKQSYWRVVK